MQHAFGQLQTFYMAFTAVRQNLIGPAIMAPSSALYVAFCFPKRLTLARITVTCLQNTWSVRGLLELHRLVLSFPTLSTNQTWVQSLMSTAQAWRASIDHGK